MGVFPPSASGSVVSGLVASGLVAPPRPGAARLGARPGGFPAPPPREGGGLRGEDGDVEHRTATFQRVRRRVRPTTREVQTRGVFRPNGREDALFRHRLCRRRRGKRTRGGGGGGSSERGRGVDKRTDDRGAKTPSRRRLGRFRRRGRVRWCGREGERDTSRRERAPRSRVRFDPPGILHPRIRRAPPPPSLAPSQTPRRRPTAPPRDIEAAAPGVTTFRWGCYVPKASPPSWRRRVVGARRVATPRRGGRRAIATPRRRRREVRRVRPRRRTRRFVSPGDDRA